jgi:hypothetical protein
MKTRWVLSLALALFLLPSAAGAAHVVWMEAELFRNLGGWTNDAQFVDQMGSPYLMAVGLSGPVADAVTRVKIPAAGKYRLWVRDRDWLPEFSPGRFQVALGGKRMETVFGRGKQPGWVWEDGRPHDLAAGELEVRLVDLSGHYGRCDALLLTDDLDYRPPSDAEGLAKARLALGGVSREVKRTEPYDTVVVGGGLAGTFAAVASARMGCRTALVQDRPVLGGNGSSEILVKPEGDATRGPLDAGEGGIIEEVRGDVQGYSERMLKLVRSTKKLDLFLNTHATGVEMKDKQRIAAVLGLDVTTGRRLAIPGETFIDCTGDGELGVWAGAEYRHGREPRSMYHESRAPEKPDRFTMGNTLRYASQLEPQPVEFHAPPWARQFRKPSDFHKGRQPQIRFGGWQWVIEYGGVLDTYENAEEIRDELLRIIWGMWDYVKNSSPRAEEARNYRLTWVSYVAGKRESRRLIGDYVLTENDIAKQVLFPDRVSYAGWGIDIHPPKGFYDDGPPAIFSHKLKFSVPFRCLYSKDLDNLLMAGRCISVSHVALGATRVMITCGLQGQAVGTAAGFCHLHQVTPRGVYQNYIDDLQQQLLKDGCYLIDLPNHDPRDLARAAKVSASSTAPPQSLARPSAGTAHPLGCDRAVLFPVTAGRIEKLSLFLESDNKKPTPLTLTLCPAENPGDFSSTKVLATATASVPPRGKGWVDFPLSVKPAPGFCYAWLPRTPGIRWDLMDPPPPQTARAYRAEEEWAVMPECYRFKPDPPAEVAAAAEVAAVSPAAGALKEMFAPANVTRGFARAIRGWPNSWRPDPAQPLPPWIELDFGEPVRFNSVHVVFQSQAMRAEAFRLEVPMAEGWRTLAEIRDNHQRRRVIPLAPTSASKLRLVLTNLREEMGICEIRAYDEP